MAQTDAIFEHIAEVNQAADPAESVLRISVDAKATVKVGPFARGGKNRVATVAADHDFHSKARVTPIDILLPALDELFVYGSTSHPWMRLDSIFAARRWPTTSTPVMWLWASLPSVHPTACLCGLRLSRR